MAPGKSKIKSEEEELKASQDLKKGKANQKRRESFSFLKSYIDNEEMFHAEDDHQIDPGLYDLGSNKPCPGKDSDSELEREHLRDPRLPPRCKAALQREEEEDLSLVPGPPDLKSLRTYEDYLDHYVTWKDLFYLESEEIARFIITLGYRVPDLLSRAEFEKVRQAIKTKLLWKSTDDRHLASEVSAEEITCPLMKALAEREFENRKGNMATIIYIRTLSRRNEEVSAWIDFRVRLNSDDTTWYDYFSGKRKLIPRISDLCYYNWSSSQVRFNSSENYLVTTDLIEGLQFMNKLNHKVVTVNPKANPGENTVAYNIKTPNYLHCMIYDHFLRAKPQDMK